ncbi:MAG: hypothetical protein JWO40_815 [Candidatus Doudnabacteria bacterium]|nr:hypothetical protein [Candidatus Doudnabacteria bacterium]
MENQIFSWKTMEFEHYEKGTGWYLTLAVIGFMMIAYQIYLHDYFAVITILVILLAIYFFSKQLPGEVDVVITNKAVTVGNVAFPYTTIKRFWIVDKNHSKKLILETTAYLNRYIILLLNDVNPEEVADILKEFLPESEPNQETMAQRLARKLRF